MSNIFYELQQVIPYQGSRVFTNEKGQYEAFHLLSDADHEDSTAYKLYRFHAI